MDKVDKRPSILKDGKTLFQVTSSIKKKLIIMIIFILLLISVLISLASFYIAKSELDSQGKIILQNTVNMTLMLIDAKNEEVKRGAISLEMAQEQVKTYILGKAAETGKTVEVIYNQNGDKKSIKEIKRPINKDIFLGKNGYTIVYGQDGMEVAHPNLEGNNIWEMREKGKQDGIYVVREQIKAGLQPGGGFVNYSWTLPNSDSIGEKITFQKLDPNWGWIIVAGTYMSDFNEGANKILYVSGIAILLSLLLGIAIALVVINRITTPIKAMVTLSEELSAGDFRDKPRRVNSTDEIGQLADSLVNMRGSISKLIKNVHESAGQLTSSSENMTASVNHSAEAANQVASAIGEVAQGADKQSRAAATTLTAVEQLSAGIKQVAKNAGTVSKVTEQTSQAAEHGGKAVAVAVNQMQVIERSVAETALTVENLGGRSKEIGQIIETISNIAGQTNLLALNAAIEAARAGEQGRGFAVVAEEVRKLAEQSQEAAKQISDLISGIQQETTQAVASMQVGKKEVDRGAEVVNSAGQGFREIAEFIGQLSGEVQSISSAIQQMAGGSQQIVDSVREIDKESKNTAGQTQNVLAATEEQAASMAEIEIASQDLATLADQLQKEIRKFTV